MNLREDLKTSQVSGWKSGSRVHTVLRGRALVHVDVGTWVVPRGPLRSEETGVGSGEGEYHADGHFVFILPS